MSALNLSNKGLTSEDLAPLQNDCFRALERLDLRGNRLSYVPAWLGSKLPALQVLQVSNNPLLEAGCSELARCVWKDKSDWFTDDKGVHVLAYISADSGQEVVPKQSVQLVTVGNEKVGKSTLLQGAWLNDPFDNNTNVVPDLERTKKVLLFDRRDERNNLHWYVRDLPGQPEFWATNAHFRLADCAVFLLVCKLSDSQETQKDQLRLWLSALQRIAGRVHCKVLVVGTFQDEVSIEKTRAFKRLVQQCQGQFSKVPFVADDPDNPDDISVLTVGNPHGIYDKTCAQRLRTTAARAAWELLVEDPRLCDHKGQFHK